MLNVSFNLSHVKYSVFSLFRIRYWKPSWSWYIKRVCYISASYLSFNININNEQTTITTIADINNTEMLHAIKEYN